MTAERPLGELTPEQQEAASQRARVVAGLRDLAALIEAHPDIPTPKWATIAHTSYGTTGELTGPEFTAAVAAMRSFAPTVVGCDLDLSDTVEAVASFGPVELRVSVPARLVAERRPAPRTVWVLPDDLAGEDPAGNWSAEQLGLTGGKAA